MLFLSLKSLIKKARNRRKPMPVVLSIKNLKFLISNVKKMIEF